MIECGVPVTRVSRSVIISTCVCVCECVSVTRPGRERALVMGNGARGTQSRC